LEIIVIFNMFLFYHEYKTNTMQQWKQSNLINSEQC